MPALEPLVIGFSAPTLAAAAPRAMLQGFAYVAGMRGAQVLVADADLDGDRQRDQIDALIRERVHALLVYPTALPETLRPALDRAAEARIPLFSHDSVAHPAVITEFVTPGAKMAALAATLMNEFMGGNGRVGVVGGIPAPQILERTQAFRQALSERFQGLQFAGEAVNETDDRAGARPAVAELLRADPALGGIFTYNDASALGAADVVENTGRKDVVIVGCNGEPQCLAAIREGRVAATVERYPVELAQQAATIMLDVAIGSLAAADAPRQVASEPEVVTAANVARFRPWEERTPQPDWERVCRFL